MLNSGSNVFPALYVLQGELRYVRLISDEPPSSYCDVIKLHTVNMPALLHGRRRFVHTVGKPPSARDLKQQELGQDGIVVTQI